MIREIDITAPAHPTPTSQTSRKIKLAAKLIIQGNSWEFIAPRIGRNGADSARRITQEYPAEWKEAKDKAYEENIDSFEAEGILTKRQLMRLGMNRKKGPTLSQQRIRDTASTAVLSHARGLRAQHINLHHDVDVENRTIIEFVLPGDNGKYADANDQAANRAKATRIPKL